MAALDDVGTLSYNGIVFSSHCSSKITGVPEYDASKRAVKWVRWTIDVHAWFSGNDLDLTMEELRKRLTKPAKELKYANRGFGELIVNSGNGKVRDVNWGPLPELFSFTPLGNARGCILDWKVSTCVPECDNARYRGISSVVYDISWGIDLDSLTTRTISGHIEIAQTRRPGTNKVLTSADEYRNEIVPSLPLQFQRVSQDFSLSTNRNILNFRFVDKELFEALPPFVSKIEVEQSLNSQMSKGFQIWDLQFSGSANTVAGVSKQFAHTAIMNTIAKRVDHFRAERARDQLKAIREAKDMPALEIAKAVSILPISFNVSEALYGNTVRITAAYQVLGVPLESILAKSGMYLPVGNDAEDWRNGTHNLYIRDRGHAMMRYVAKDEALIDLCVPEADVGEIKDTLQNAVLREANARVKGNNAKPVVNPAASWLMYQNDLENVANNRVAVHKRIPVEDPDKLDPPAKGPAANGKVDAVKNEVKAEVSGKLPPKDQRDVVQRLGGSSHLVRMHGFAMRLQHKIAAPRLLKIGGRDAVQLEETVNRMTGGSIGDVEVHITTWSIVYALDGRPDGETPSLANPVYDTDGGKKA